MLFGTGRDHSDDDCVSEVSASTRLTGSIYDFVNDRLARCSVRMGGVWRTPIAIRAGAECRDGGRYGNRLDRV